MPAQTVEINEVRNVVEIAPVTNEVTVSQTNNTVTVSPGFDPIHPVGGSLHDLTGSLALGTPIVDSARLAMKLPATIAPAGTIYDMVFQDTNAALGKNLTLLDLQRTTGSPDMSGFTLTSFIGYNLQPTLKNTGASVNVTNVIALSIGLHLFTNHPMNVTNWENIRCIGGLTNTGTITNVRRIHVTATTFFAGTVISAYDGLYFANMGNAAITGTLAAIRIAEQLNATTNRSIIVEGTNAPSIHNPAMSIGTANAPATSAALDIDSTTGALLVPRMTTTERNALTATNGMQIYNTTTQDFNVFRDGSWWSINLTAA